MKHLVPLLRSLKSPRFCALLLLATVGLPPALTAQTPAFDCGSNGSYGPMNITQDTALQIPPDGVFHCTTVNITEGAKLFFTSNALNTPVYILATGDITMGGLIDVSGKAPLGLTGGAGGPGGFAGGSGNQDISHPAGDGSGPGGGIRAIYNPIVGQSTGSHAGAGWYRTGGPNGSNYGNSLLIPMLGGSGGGGGFETSGIVGSGGGGGGGAILLASNRRITFPPPQTNINRPYINAPGGNAGGSLLNAGYGSGGAVRIVAPVVSGSLFVDVSNQLTGVPTGRFRIDALDSSGLTNRYHRPDAVGSVMVVFPSPMPKLSILNAAGTAIAENANAPVMVTLPTGSPSNQTITVRARDFGYIVPIRIRLVPESGDPIVYDTTIDNTVTNPADATVPVVMPLNTGVNVQVYSR